ncbi:MAG: AAA family ATPase, partial [Paraglaciecola sp.]|nr:AAA family ATPase [Paraglaciecola sp.]
PEYPQELLEREAINAMFQESVNAEEDLTTFDELADPSAKALPSDGLNLKEYISDLEVSLITQALDQQDWVVARAAEVLGMRRTTLVEKMRKYTICKD